MSEISDLTAAINRLAAAFESATVPPTADRRPPTADRRPPHPAELLPQPKGYMCAAGCGHGTAVHRDFGCNVATCDCPAPHGRLMPAADVPDDISTITERG